MASTVDVTCARKGCNQVFAARVADRKRGWGKFCSKSCKAMEQESRTHQNAKYHQRRARSNDIEDSFHPYDSYSLGQE